jgi:parallel beta-helix repeat protein
VLQGPNNIDNYVYNNKISDARGQGVLLAYCEKFLLAKNDISRNYNGILAVTSVVNVEDNHIADNKCNGIMLVDDCQLLMTENQIEGNRKAGLIARNTSTARMRQNRFNANKIELLVERGWDTLQDVEKENEFTEGADVRIPGNLCSLI